MEEGGILSQHMKALVLGGRKGDGANLQEHYDRDIPTPEEPAKTAPVVAEPPVGVGCHIIICHPVVIVIIFVVFASSMAQSDEIYDEEDQPDESFDDLEVEVDPRVEPKTDNVVSFVHADTE